jgi:drug/metabolite transporter, DME family
LRSSRASFFRAGPTGPPDSSRRSRRLGRLCVLAAALCWSLSGVVTKALDLGPLPIAFYRSLFAGLALLPLVPRGGWEFRLALVPLGLVFGAMIGLYISAVIATTAANAIYLQYTATFWMIPLSAWLLGERPDGRSVAGIALGMVGIAVIVARGYNGRPNEGLGVAFGLASGLAYACVAVGIRGLRDLHPIWLSAVANLGGALALGAWIIATTGGIPVPTSATMAALVGFGVIQMALPYALFARGLREIGAVEAGLIALIEPLVNPVWVALAHGERPAPATLFGGSFLLAGLACRFWPSRASVVPAGPRSPVDPAGPK